MSSNTVLPRMVYTDAKYKGRKNLLFSFGVRTESTALSLRFLISKRGILLPTSQDVYGAFEEADVHERTCSVKCYTYEILLMIIGKELFILRNTHFLIISPHSRIETTSN